LSQSRDGPELDARYRLFAVRATKPTTNAAAAAIFNQSAGLALITANTIRDFPSVQFDRLCVATIAPISPRATIRPSESKIKPNSTTATAAISQENFASGVILTPP
jgi:hypothetical protein